MPRARELGPSGVGHGGERWVEGGATTTGWSSDDVGSAGGRVGVERDDGPGVTDTRRGARRADRSRPPWFRLPDAFVGARWAPNGRAVLGLALAVVLAVVLFGLRVGWASSGGTVLAPGGGSRAGPTGLSAGAVPVGTGAGATTGAGVPSSSAAPSSSGAPGMSGVVVHVVGQVRRPGLQRLPPGSRVADAVEAAGGATRKADLARVNLARVLVDGEQVAVPAPGDPDPPLTSVPVPGPSGASPSGGAGTVSVNSADLAALDTLPGVGPVLAQRILDWRSEHGRFTSIDELGEVSGIGEKLLEQLRPRVTL